MRNPFFNRFWLFVVVAILTAGCEKDKVSPTKSEGKVTFTFTVSENSGGRTAAAEAKRLLITIKNASGAVVHEKKEILLYNFGVDLISEPIALNSGHYSLAEFLVLDESKNVLYATPIQGSELAYLVQQPLPIDFNIIRDETLKLNPEVIEIGDNTAADFGYANFTFNQVETIDFPVGVLAYNALSKNFELTTSSVLITNADGGTLYSKEHDNVTTVVRVHDGISDYLLTVTKPGYISYTRRFTAAELAQYNAQNALVVLLLEQSMSEGLVAYYPFNGNANDLSGNGLHGVVNGAVMSNDRHGIANAAYQFDGQNDYINVAHNDLLNLETDFTVSLWANISSSQITNEGVNDILRKWNGQISAGYPFAIAYLNEVAYPYTDQLILARFNGTCGNSPTAYSDKITNDVYIHIVLLKQGNLLKHYVNNILVAEVTDTTPVCSIANTIDMTIGCRGNLVRFFKGQIDDIRIYSRALSTDELNVLYYE